MILLVSGCATANKNSDLETRLSSLELRTTSLEQQQNVIGQGISDSAVVDYVVGNEKTTPKIRWTNKKIQIALNKAGFYNGQIDGSFGKDTKKAIKEFQKANGLKADGIIGRRTKDKLSGYLMANTEIKDEK